MNELIPLGPSTTNSRLPLPSFHPTCFSLHGQAQMERPFLPHLLRAGGRIQRWVSGEALCPSLQGRRGPRPSSGIRNRVSRGLHPNRLGGFEAVTSRVQREQPRPRPRTADDPEDGTGLCAQRALGDPRGRPGVLGAGVPGAARCEGSGRSPISQSHRSVRAPPISAREPPVTAPHVGPYGLATPAPDWPTSSQ